MWIRCISLFGLLFLLSCKPPTCTEEEQAAQLQDVVQAYDSWEYHLNYLDPFVVFSDSEFLKCRIRDLHVCSPLDTTIISRIDSAIWYFTHDPVTTEHMERGDMLVHEVEGFVAELEGDGV